MKVYLSIIIVVILGLNSCEKNDIPNKDELSVLTPLEGENGLSYIESFNKWTELKKENGNSYIYQTTFLSWTGFGSTTELKVIDGKVIARIYEEYETVEETGKKLITESYAENEGDLGSHEKGVSPWTIDDLYNSCASNYLIVDEDNISLYFKTESNGLMTLCGFVHNACDGDCYRGISIDSFDWIN